MCVRTYFYCRQAFAIFFVVSFMMPVALIARAIVFERETRLRERMRIVGLKLWPLTVSWYITYTVIFFIISIFVVVLTQATIFGQSGVFLTWLMFFLFGLTTIAFGYMVRSRCMLEHTIQLLTQWRVQMSVFFSHAKTAAVVSALLYFAGFFPYFAVSASTDSYTDKV